MVDKRVIEIDDRLKEIQELINPLCDESSKLEDERETILTESALIEVKKYVFDLEEYEKESFYKIRLRCEKSTENILCTKLYELNGSYQCCYQFGDKVILRRDNDEVYLLFQDVEIFKSFIENNKISITTSNFKRRIDEYKKDIQTLEDIS